MTNIVEKNRRVHILEDDGIACGPCDITVVDAEIIVDDNGQEVYLHGQWVSAADDVIAVDAAKESIYEIYAKESTDEITDDDIVAIERILEKGLEQLGGEDIILQRYEKQFADLVELIKETVGKLFDGEWDKEDCIEISYRT